MTEIKKTNIKTFFTSMAATAPLLGASRSIAANAGSVVLTAELTRLNTDRLVTTT